MPASSRQQLLALRPVEGLVQRAAEAVEQLVDLLAGDDQWRADRERIAGALPENEPLLLAEPHGARGDVARRLERLLGAAIGDQLDRAHQADAACFSYQRVIAERFHPRLELRDHRRD